MDISVIIPTYDKHQRFLPEAIMSVDFSGEYEIIVVNDSPNKPLTIKLKNVRVINRREDQPRFGAGGGRNVGARVATGKCLLFLDSDDKLIYKAMDRMWFAYQELLKETGLEHVIYGDLIHGATGQVFRCKPPYDGDDIMEAPIWPEKSRRPYMCLVPKIHHDKIGGFPSEDEIYTYEELVYEADMWVQNIPQAHINTVTYDYRWWKNSRRTLAKPDGKNLALAVKEFFYNRYEECINNMTSCGTCGNKPKTVPAKAFAPKTPTALPTAANDEKQFLVYVGQLETKRISGPTGIQYKFDHRRFKEREIVDLPPEKINVATQVHVEDAKAFYRIQTRGYDEFTERRLVVEGYVAPKQQPQIQPKAQPKPPTLAEMQMAQAFSSQLKQPDFEPGPVAEASDIKPPMSLVTEWTVEAIKELLPSLNKFDIDQLIALEMEKPKPRKTLLQELE